MSPEKHVGGMSGGRCRRHWQQLTRKDQKQSENQPAPTPLVSNPPLEYASREKRERVLAISLRICVLSPSLEEKAEYAFHSGTRMERCVHLTGLWLRRWYC